MRAIVLMRVPGDPDKILPTLTDCCCNVSFIRDSHAVVESVHVAFGAANFWVQLFGATQEEIFRGLRLLRSRVDQKLAESSSESAVATSTIVGWTPEAETGLQNIVRRAVAEVTGRIEQSKSTQIDIDDLITRSAIDIYVEDRVRDVKRLLDSYPKSGLDGAERHKRLLSAVEDFLSVPRVPAAGTGAP